MACRIALADDQCQVLESVRRILAARPDLEIVVEVLDGTALLEWLRNTPVAPDLIITDITMPGVSGIEIARRTRLLWPEAKVLILTMHEEEEYLAQAMSAGASGYLLKDDAGQELIAAIQIVLAGETYISPYLRPIFNARPPSEHADAQLPGGNKPPMKNGSAQASPNHRNSSGPHKSSP